VGRRRCITHFPSPDRARWIAHRCHLYCGGKNATGGEALAVHCDLNGSLDDCFIAVLRVDRCPRILADHYQKVALMERDTFPALGQHRRGVPQGRHAHGVLASGSDVLERLFPRISTELAEAGALTGDIAGDVRWFFEGGFLRQFESGLTGFLMSRPLLDGTVRRRVLIRPGDAQRPPTGWS
jgi:hypothetical protein